MRLRLGHRWGAVPILPLLMTLVPSAHAVPLNVILFIGDGMGFEHIEAARYFDNGDTSPLLFETFAYQGQMTHNNFSDSTTDSAASGTAMATGVKVNNGVISQEISGDGSNLPTVLEILQGQGKRTGLVTSDTSITDATPAAFGAHEPSRSNHTQIANDYLNDSRPNILFGGTQATIVSDAPGAGYTLVTTGAAFGALDPEAHTYVAGAFSSAEQPTLADMTTKALNLLDNDPDGLFLMVEHEGTDSGGHANNISTVVNSALELEDAVQAALNWATGVGALADTLIVVTADHETGGLTTNTNNGAGVLPGVSWSTGGHTQSPVPVFATGPMADASRVTGTIDNTDIHFILTGTEPFDPDSIPGLQTFSFQQNVDGYTGTVDTFLQQDNPGVDNSSEPELNIDGDDPGGSGLDVQALLRFENIFGSATDQIPLDATIITARLELDVTNAGDNLEVYRMLEAWADTDTWTSLIGGVSPDGIEALASLESSTGGLNTGTATIDVTDSLIAWRADPLSNRGWVFLPTDTNGVDFFSAEGTTPPRLVVQFLSAVPEPGTFLSLALGLLLLRAGSRRRARAYSNCWHSKQDRVS